MSFIMQGNKIETNLDWYITLQNLIVQDMTNFSEKKMIYRNNIQVETHTFK